ncbi:MAG: hypothetical protein CVT77_12165 [Alphaproteobacteria bacterium HGW-Alphaproteobacteria-16]|nr:MAG: hypothetical protein CVT77_12165 [Alphaproteobacteria bacterium HGW-Alphaproteobacteria-16]
MAARLARSLDDVLRGGANIRPRCRCGHVSVISCAQLRHYFSIHRWDTHLHRVGEHLYCSRCFRRPVEVGVSFEDPNSPPFGPRNQQELTQLIRRLRNR